MYICYQQNATYDSLVYSLDVHYFKWLKLEWFVILNTTPTFSIHGFNPPCSTSSTLVLWIWQCTSFKITDKLQKTKLSDSLTPQKNQSKISVNITVICQKPITIQYQPFTPWSVNLCYKNLCALYTSSNIYRFRLQTCKYTNQRSGGKLPFTSWGDLSGRARSGRGPEFTVRRFGLIKRRQQGDYYATGCE